MQTLSRLRRAKRERRIKAGLRPRDVVAHGNEERLETAKYDGRRHWWRLHPTKGWRREAL